MIKKIKQLKYMSVAQISINFQATKDLDLYNYVIFFKYTKVLN